MVGAGEGVAAGVVLAVVLAVVAAVAAGLEPAPHPAEHWVASACTWVFNLCNSWKGEDSQRKRQKQILNDNNIRHVEKSV